MGILVVCAIIIGIVSLYDYFSTKSWNSVTSAKNRNDVVFDGRNKEFGAYVIRRDYNRSLIFIMISIILCFGLAYGGMEISRHFSSQDDEGDATEVMVEYLEVFDKEEEEEEPQEEIIIPDETPQEVVLEAQIEFVEMKVTDKVVDTKVPTQDDLGESKAGTSTVEKTGDNAFGTTVPSGPVVQPKIEPKTDEPALIVEEDAEFPGGRKAMLQYLANNIRYPESAVAAGIEGKTTLRFVVDVDGKISDVKVLRGIAGCKECDAEAARVIRTMPKWKPGKNGGKAVKSYFDLPVVFKLQ